MLPVGIIMFTVACYVFVPTEDRLVGAWSNRSWSIIGALKLELWPDGTIRSRYRATDIHEGVWRLSGFRLQTEAVQQADELHNRIVPTYHYRSYWVVMLGPGRLYFLDRGHTMHRYSEVLESEAPARGDAWPERPRKPDPMMAAVMATNVNKVKRLIRNDRSLVQKRGYDGCTPLFNFASQGDVAMVTFLLENGATANDTNQHGYPILSMVIMEHNEGRADALVAVLLQHGADANLGDNCGATALHAAGIRGYGAVARRLLKHDADPNIRCSHGLSALDYASKRRQSHVVALLEPLTTNVVHSTEARSPQPQAGLRDTNPRRAVPVKVNSP